MSGEALFKSIVSGEDQSVLGDIARSSLGLLSKGYEKAVSIRNARFDEGKGVTKVTVPVISVGNITAGGTGKHRWCDLFVMCLLRRAFILLFLVVDTVQKIITKILLFLKMEQCL